jgi:hypothetical protein
VPSPHGFFKNSSSATNRLGEAVFMYTKEKPISDEMMFTCTENSNQSVASGCNYVEEQQPISGGYSQNICSHMKSNWTHDFASNLLQIGLPFSVC